MNTMANQVMGHPVVYSCEDQWKTSMKFGMLFINNMEHNCPLYMFIDSNKYVFFSNRWRKLQWNGTNSHGSTVGNIQHGVEDVLRKDDFLTL